jgi:hypothetical protein
LEIESFIGVQNESHKKTNNLKSDKTNKRKIELGFKYQYKKRGGREVISSNAE